MNKIQIIWFTENYYPDKGGMAESCDRIVDSLKKENTIIHLFHFTNKGKPFDTKVKSKGTYTAIPYSDDMEHISNLLWIHLERFTKSYKCDYLVAFGGYYPILCGPIYSQFLQIPFILMFRGNDFDLSIYSPKRRDLVLYAIDKSSIIFVNSQSKKEKISLLAPHKKLVFLPNSLDTFNWIPNKIDLQRANDIKSTIDSDKKVIGFFGHLKTKKGVPFFLEVLLKIKSHKFHLIFVGDLNDESKESLLNLKDISYTIIPFLDKDSLIPYYLSCDCISIPSFYEGMPNVLLESTALGIPAIASSIDGIKDLLINTSPNFLFDANDPDSCREAILKFCNTNTEELKLLKNNLIQLIKNSYNPKNESLIFLNSL